MNGETPLFFMELRFEQDIVIVRQVARQVAALLKFDVQDQTRIATAISEVARVALLREGRHGLRFLVGENEGEFRLKAVFTGLDPVLDFRQGLVELRGALGQAGAQRLMDEMGSEEMPGHEKSVWLAKRIPRNRHPLSQASLEGVSRELMRRVTPQSAFEEVRQQNLELMEVLEKLRVREAELAQLNHELEETNRGVLALYAELDEKATSLQQANEAKSRFFSHLSHEIRTPLNSVLSLTTLLLDDDDEPLRPEQERQVRYIRKAVSELSEMVNDLLDAAKIEAGKLNVKVETFDVVEFLGALRGMFRPLVPEGSPVTLVFDMPVGFPPLETDETKLAQILRNLISNAIKFTPSGEVRVAATKDDSDVISFSVTDSGVGIAREHQERVFEEFVQIEQPFRSPSKGTGLGLPLARRLAELLGGTLTVESEPGKGSRFTATIPIRYVEPRGPGQRGGTGPEAGDGTARGTRGVALIVDDDEVSRYLLAHELRQLGFETVEGRDGAEGMALARLHRPQLLFLDLIMPVMDGCETLRLLKEDPVLRAIPVIIHSTKRLDGKEFESLKEVVADFVPKSQSGYRTLLLDSLKRLGFLGKGGSLSRLSGEV